MISIIFIVFFLLLLLLFRKNRYGIFYILTVFIGLSLIDTFIPSLLWNVYGIPERPFWFQPLSYEDMVIGLLYYSLFYMIMFFVTIMLSNKKKIDWAEKFKLHKREKFIRNRLLYLLIFTGFMFLISVYSEINSYGGYSQWLIQKFTVRFNPTANEAKNLFDLFITKIPWRALFNALVFLAFLYRYKIKREKLYGAVFPIIAILFALSTSYRGSILQVLLGLIFIEYMRIKIHAYYHYNSDFGQGYETVHKPKFYIFGVVIIVAFTAYGSIRDSYAAEILNTSKSKESAIFKVLNQGSGIEGISSIIKQYGTNVDYFYGKTYLDMLLLPIPRAIYSSKPEWYGIDDITRRMGWPKTTQSAVTMPGEAFANFGWFGLLIAVCYGFLFGSLLRFINNKGGIYLILYPSIIIPMIFVSNWMAFTGIMNLFFTSIFILFLLKVVIVRLRVSRGAI